MKTLADLLKALAAITNATDLATAQNAAQSLVEDLNDFDSGYKGELGKKNSEAQGLRTRLKQAETLTASLEALKGTHGKVLKSLGFEDDVEDLDAALEAVVEKIKTGESAGKSKGELENQMVELRKQLTSLTKQAEKANTDNKTLTEQLSQERTKRQGSLKQTELLNLLTANKAVKPDKLAKMLMHSVEIDAENEDALLFINDTGEKVPLKDGLAKFLTDNPEFVENTQKGGSGSRGGNGGGGKLRATSAQLKDPSFYRANRDAIMKGDVEVVDE